MKNINIPFPVSLLILTFGPLLTIILLDGFSGLTGLNSFLFIPLLFIAAPIVFVGWIITMFKQAPISAKAIITVAAIVQWFLLFPMIWGIQSVKEDMFLVMNHKQLELVSDSVLHDHWTIDEANTYLSEHNLDVKINANIELDQEMVFFFIDGFFGNCHGIAYSATPTSPTLARCGKITSWKPVRTNWYSWTAS